MACPASASASTRTWDELGEFETIVPNWSVGDEFTTGDGRRFRIVGIVGVPDDVGIYNALWKVESVPTDGLR